MPTDSDDGLEVSTGPGGILPYNAPMYDATVQSSIHLQPLRTLDQYQSRGATTSPFRSGFSGTLLAIALFRRPFGARASIFRWRSAYLRPRPQAEFLSRFAAGIDSCLSEPTNDSPADGHRRRRRLTLRLRRWIELGRAVGAKRLLVDGSFVTAQAEPNDVDAVMRLPDNFADLVAQGLKSGIGTFYFLCSVDV
jgi:hypothetical protein